MRETIEKILQTSYDEGLSSLLIGGNSLAFCGNPRNTLDIDFLIPQNTLQEWEDLLVKFGYAKFHATGAFAQFKGEGTIPLDLMLVESSTWEKFNSEAIQFSLGSVAIMLPAPEHIVALKLHSANSPYRSKPEQDWEDIRALY